MKKILYITTSYTLKNSSAAIRNNGLVKGLVSFGNIVDVYTVQWPKDMTSDFLYQEKNGNIIMQELPRLKIIASMKAVSRSKSNSSFITKSKSVAKSLLFFPDTTSQWIKLFPYSQIDISAYDVMITSSDHKTAHLIGNKLKRRYPSLKWLQIWGDPWSSDVNTPFILKKLAAHYEKLMLHNADGVIYVSRPTMNYISEKYPQFKSKLHYVPRSYYFDSLNFVPVTDGKLRIVYTGVISFGRNVMPFIEAINKYPELHSKVLFDIYGTYNSEIQSMLDHFCFVNQKGSVDFEEMSKVYASASLLVYLSNKKGSSQIPGKLYDYFGTSSPILCLVEDENDQTSMFLKQFNRCIVIHNDIDSILKKINVIIDCLNCRFEPEMSYSPYSIAKQIMDVVE